MNRPILISLIGAPASGKGYIVKQMIKQLQADYNLKKEDINVISVGDIIRKQIAENSLLVRKIPKIKDLTSLAPDSIANMMVYRRLKASKAKATILDGYPRTLNQAKELDKFATNYDHSTFYRNTKTLLLLERAQDRMICGACGSSQVSKNGGCSCDGKLVKRKDDEELSKRIFEYEKKTKPAIRYLTLNSNSFHEFDGKIEGAETTKTFLNRTMNKSKIIYVDFRKRQSKSF